MTATEAPWPEHKRATAADVAELAGVSRTSVSFAFNRPDRIGEETRSKILETADRIGYQPSTIGRMLSSGRTSSLGLLLPQDIPDVMQNPYYAQFIVGVGQVCRAEGLTLLLVPPTRNSMLKAIPDAAVDGFIVSGLEIDRGEVDELRRRDVPFVLVDSEAPDDVPSVDVDDAGGAEDMMEHLFQLGHERIAIVAFESGPDRPVHGYRGPLARRIDGIQRALEAHGETLGHKVKLVEAPATRSGGLDVTTRLLTNGEPPTAIFALSDILAIGAIDAARQLGRSVPGDVSIAGYDDLPEASWIHPRLTTVRQPIVAKGRLAGDFLVAALGGQSQHPHQVLQTALVTRESTGAPA